jgi:hypothetical protein
VRIKRATSNNVACGATVTTSVLYTRSKDIRGSSLLMEFLQMKDRNEAEFGKELEQKSVPHQ